MRKIILNLSIKNKLAFGFSFMIICIIFLGTFNYLKISEINNSYSLLFSDRVDKLISAQNLVITFQQMVLNDRAYLITGNEEYVNQYEDTKKTFNEQYDLLVTKIITPEGKELAIPLKATFNDFVNYAEQAIVLKRQGNTLELTNLLKSGSSLIKDMNKDLKDLMDYQMLRMNDGIKANNTDISVLLKYLIIMISMVVIIGIIIIISISHLIASPLKLLNIWAAKVSSGDFTSTEIAIKNKDEVGQLAQSFSLLAVSLKEMINQLKKKAGEITISAENFTTNSQQTAAAANETAATVSQMTTAIEQVNTNINKISETSKVTAELAIRGEQNIEKVTGQIRAINSSAEDAAGAINSLKEKSLEIGKIIYLITQIADQTNLLALNAAIEAARAGENGKGFAVVADEVRKLAEQSANAAKEIYSLVNTIQGESNRATEIMDVNRKEALSGTQVVLYAGQSFREIINTVKALNSEINNVAEASYQISLGMQNVSASTEEQTAILEEVSAASETLFRLSDEMNRLANRFTTG